MAGVHGLELLRSQRGDVQVRLARITASPVQPQKSGVQVEGGLSPILAKQLGETPILDHAVVVAEGERLGLSAGELQGVEPSAHVDLLIMSTRGPMDGILSCILYLRTPLFFKHDSRMRDSAQKSWENLLF